MSFFKTKSDESAVKARIVEKYFSVWSKVVAPTAKKRGNKLGYIDLFAGPGRYRDGSASTPIMVLQSAVRDPDLSQMLVSFFNDQDENHTRTLESEIAKIENINSLKYPPVIRCSAIGDTVAEFLNATRLIPSFSFVDPFGYKGLSLKIVNGVIKDWGCDCVFFFNYNRINAGLSNRNVTKHMAALFGETLAKQLMQRLKGLKPHQREALVLESLTQAIKTLGGSYVLPFRFKSHTGKRTKHCLIFVSKHFKGYDIMKKIMSSESSSREQGVPSLEYSTALEQTPLLTSLTQPLKFLEEQLRVGFSGLSISFEDLYQKHSVDTPFIRANYREIILKLEMEGAVQCVPAKRAKGTLAGRVLIHFSRLENGHHLTH